MSTPKYFEQWIRARNQGLRPLSQQEAGARHAAGGRYVALLYYENEKFVVDVAGDWVLVMFFDSEDRVYMQYDFKLQKPGRLFLSFATHIEYEGENTQPQMAIMFAFKTDGSIIIEQRNMATGEAEEKDSHGDPAANWEAYPEFGDYRSVCRANREPN